MQDPPAVYPMPAARLLLHAEFDRELLALGEMIRVGLFHALNVVGMNDRPPLIIMLGELLGLVPQHPGIIGAEDGLAADDIPVPHAAARRFEDGPETLDIVPQQRLGPLALADVRQDGEAAAVLAGLIKNRPRRDDGDDRAAALGPPLDLVRRILSRHSFRELSADHMSGSSRQSNPRATGPRSRPPRSSASRTAWR